MPWKQNRHKIATALLAILGLETPRFNNFLSGPTNSGTRTLRGPSGDSNDTRIPEVKTPIEKMCRRKLTSRRSGFTPNSAPGERQASNDFLSRPANAGARTQCGSLGNSNDTRVPEFNLLIKNGV
jgi:hypothetical protein